MVCKARLGTAADEGRSAMHRWGGGSGGRQGQAWHGERGMGRVMQHKSAENRVVAGRWAKQS